jgi:uncharacterized protein (DUF1697 family)
MIDFDSLITSIEAFDILPVCHRLVAVEMTAENLANVSIQAKKTSPTLIEEFNDKAKRLYSSDLSCWMYNLILGLSHINKRSYLYTLYDIKGNVTIINELHNNINQEDFKTILKDFFTAHYSDIPFDRFLIEKRNLNYEFRETLWNYVLDETKYMDSLEILVELLPYKTFRSNVLLLSCTAAEQIKPNNKKLWWTFWQRITKYQVLTRHMINKFAYTIITNQEWATNVIKHSPDLWGCDSKIIKLFKEKQITQLV